MQGGVILEPVGVNRQCRVSASAAQRAAAEPSCRPTVIIDGQAEL